VECSGGGSDGTCPPGSTPIGIWCVDDFRRSVQNFAGATETCDAEARTICPVEAMMACDLLNPTTSNCRIDTDTPGTRLWTSTFDAAFDTKVFQAIAIYGGDEVIRPGNAGEFYPFYCCGVRTAAPLESTSSVSVTQEELGSSAVELQANE
jgi:hypothetical protein